MSDSKLPGARCTECPLRECQAVPPFVPDERAEYIMVGEAPGYYETVKKRPFSGESGRFLNAFVELILGGVRPPIFLTNVVACRPPDNAEPPAAAIECCRGRLDAELSMFEGVPILAMGNVALQRFVAEGDHVSTKSVRGKWFDTPYGLVMPTWHPAYVLRSPEEAVMFIRDMKKYLSKVVNRPIDVNNPPKVVWIRTPYDFYNELGGWIYGNDYWSFDIEANQNDWQRSALLMVGVLRRDDDGRITHGYVLDADLFYDYEDVLPDLRRFFKNNRFCGHNSKFDWHFLDRFGIEPNIVFDSMLANYALDELKGHGLKTLAREVYDILDYDKQYVGRYLSGKSDEWSKVPEDVLAQYLVLDCAVTRCLADDLPPRLVADNVYDKPFNLLLMPMNRLCFHMEKVGMMVDIPFMIHVEEMLNREQIEVREKLREMSGHPELNPNSPMQLSKIIWDEMKLPPPPTKKIRQRMQNLKIIKDGSTNEVALSHLAKIDEGGRTVGYIDPFLDVLFRYRHIAKVKSTYISPVLSKVDPNNRYHDDIRIIGTETGRLSTFLHTMPRESGDFFLQLVRASFIAPYGMVFVHSDHSQAELRMAGALSHDPFIIGAYNEGRDLHTDIINAAFGTKDELGEERWAEARMIVKRLNFAYIYGGAVAALVSDKTIPPQIRTVISEKYETSMSGFRKMRDDLRKFMNSHGYVVSPFGRKRRFPFINNENIYDAEMASINQPIQSAAADLTNLAAIRLLDEGYSVVLTKHDEVIIEVSEDNSDVEARYIADVMENVASEYFPEVIWKADAKVSKRWGKLPSSLSEWDDRTGLGMVVT